MLRDSIDMVFKQGRTLDTQRIHQEKLIKQVIQFPPGRMVILAKEFIMIGPPAGGGVLGMTSCYRVIKGSIS